jgi:hypothetical protein
MADHERWYEDRDRQWGGGRAGRHDYGRYADEGYRGRDENGRPYERNWDEPRSFGRRTPDYDAAPYGDGAAYGREGDRGSGRDWWDRARDEVASWVGDRRAEQRRRWDRVRGEHRGHGPRGYRRSDERIREDVNDRLTDDSWLDASDIEVAVHDGEVTLTGNVSSRADKRRAEDLADDVSGVVHVQNNLRPREARMETGPGER